MLHAQLPCSTVHMVCANELAPVPFADWWRVV